ncbi:MAG: histidine phosphatase family protein [Chitinophagales bacterium]
MKRELVLIRHTKSSWANFNMRDFDRPLKKDRINDALDMGQHLKEQGLKPDLIICSPAVRTRQTAELFCDKLGYSFDQIVLDMRLYESSAAEYRQVISEVDLAIKTLVVIGHNPSITDFFNQLMDPNLDEVPTTGVIWLEFDGESWEIKNSTNGRLKKLLWPKILKML